ncbi:MAG: hypothetical protein CBE07_002995 [Pelagibacteraceae bacterium TMED247]|nr:MAG: hypothetical protein CBE07_002995 [Pelagibacteraceae bacterium TMED247]|tara:strand:+ start:995 stop:1669 length:675 start_codon:yes stop_codon:yes gene_type:complete
MSWIKETAKIGKNINGFYSFNSADLYVIDALPEYINVGEVLKSVVSRIPQHLCRGVDVVYVGQFKDLKDRKINAMFQDGAIYVTNEQDDDEDFLDDIVHEIAHAVEAEYPDYIYKDGKLFSEFMGKRKRLFHTLKFHEYNIDPIFKIKPDFDKEIDQYLYKVVGYEKLNNMTIGLFPSAYSSVSISEYFATGFEDYFIGDQKTLKRDCPVLFSKLEILLSLGEK